MSIFSLKKILQLLIVMSEPKPTALPEANFTETKSNSYTQTLAQGCLQLQADGGHIYDLLLLWSSHHVLFLISQPCNPVWHKDGC